jgi:hypothetical protein
MTPEQKQRIAHEISNWRNARNDHSSQITGDRMSALLQELVDAPGPEPFAVIHLDGSFVHVEFKQPIAGTGKFEVYAAPSVPDGWRGLTDVEWMNIVNFDRAYSSYDKEGAVNEAVKRTEAKLKELNAAQQQEPPADLVRDAERGPETLLLRQLQDLLADYGLFELLSAVRRVEQDETIRLQNAAIERDKLKGAK